MNQGQLNLPAISLEALALRVLARNWLAVSLCEYLLLGVLVLVIFSMEVK